MSESKPIADADALHQGILQMTETLGAEACDPSKIAFIGIHTHGVPLARRMKALFDTTHGTDAPLGTLDINLYRDDYDLRGVKPRIQSSEIRFTLEGLEVVLVDDVLYTGRTIRAAIEALGDYGRPSAIRLAVLVDRGHRELPIQADHAAFVVATERDDRIRVRMREVDGNDEVLLIPGGGKSEP